MTLRIDFDNAERMALIQHTLKPYIPTTGYHFSCNSCQMTNAARNPQPRVTCAFCGYTCDNDNYAAWQKLKEIMEK